MPRPRKDYDLTLQEDLDRLDQRIELLLIERERKAKMLAIFNAPITVNVKEFLEQRAAPSTTVAMTPAVPRKRRQ